MDDCNVVVYFWLREQTDPNTTDQSCFSVSGSFIQPASVWCMLKTKQNKNIVEVELVVMLC